MTVATDGVSTQRLGGLQINSGLMMLGLAIPNRHAALPCPALRCMLACVALGAMYLVMVIRFKLA